ncbi:hypothetical protein LINGRAHAP2_LOCUS32903 [Linum grandiflorum]
MTHINWEMVQILEISGSNPAHPMNGHQCTIYFLLSKTPVWDLYPHHQAFAGGGTNIYRPH